MDVRAVAQWSKMARCRWVADNFKAQHNALAQASRIVYCSLYNKDITVISRHNLAASAWLIQALCSQWFKISGAVALRHQPEYVVEIHMQLH